MSLPPKDAPVSPHDTYGHRPTSLSKPGTRGDVSVPDFEVQVLKAVGELELQILDEVSIRVLHNLSSCF